MPFFLKKRWLAMLCMYKIQVNVHFLVKVVNHISLHWTSQFRVHNIHCMYTHNSGRYITTCTWWVIPTRVVGPTTPQPLLPTFASTNCVKLLKCSISCSGFPNLTTTQTILGITLYMIVSHAAIPYMQWQSAGDGQY